MGSTRVLAEAAARHALEQICDGFFTLDHEWRYTYLNKASEAYFDRRREELLGRVMWEVFPGLLGTELERVYRAAMASAEAVDLELFGPLRRRWSKTRMFPTREGLSVSFCDITDRKRIEEALHESEARYRALFENGFDGSFLTSVKGEVFAVNPAGCRMLQYTEAALIARGGDLLVPADDPAVLHLAGEIRRERRVCGEVTLTRSDGTRLPVEISAALFTDRDGQERASMAMRDLSEHKRADEALSLLTEAGRLLPASLDGDATLAALARLVVPRFADACVVDMLDDGGSLRFVDFGAPDARGAAAPSRRLVGARPRAVTRALASGEVECVPTGVDAWAREALDDDPLLAPALTPAMHSVIVAPIAARGVSIGAVTFLRRAPQVPFDDADVRVAQGLADRAALALDNAHHYADAVQSKLRRDEMIGVVSHDLRTPLNTIQLSAQLAARRAPGIELETILAAAARADRLVQDLLALSAIESGQLPLDRKAHAVAGLVEEVVALHRPIADSRQMRIALDIDDGAATLLVDRHRMLQALSNLVGNALKFSPDKSVVTVRARPLGESVAISVVDQGPGIEAAHLPHLFDRFWQAKGAKGGVGLGLAIARGIVEAHGGALDVESVPGEGATFTLTLPRTS